MAAAGDLIGAYRMIEMLDYGDLWQYWLSERDGTRYLTALLPRWHEEEARTQAPARLRARLALRHPRIPELVTFFETSHAEHSFAAVYEHVPSVTFAEIVHRQRGPLPPEIAARMIERVARLIHEARIAPRWCNWAGLEPTSLWVDPSGAVWWLLNPEIDPPMNVTGPGIVRRRLMDYMSPEAVRGAPLVPQSPVFSLGVMLYELVTGVHPFRGDTIIQQFVRTHEGQYDRLAERATLGEPAVSPPIAATVDRALSLNPEDRFAHAGELAEALHGSIPRSVGERDIFELAAHLLPWLEDVEFERRDTVPSTPAADGEARLLQEIAANRDSPDAYLVYADWLQSEGRVRGELIVLQNEARQTKDVDRLAELATAERALLAAHPALLESLTDLIGSISEEGPMFDAGPHYVGSSTTGPLVLEWYLGFVRAARILVDRVDIHDVFSRFESSESTRFLRELTIGTVAPRDRSPHHILDQIYDALASSRLDVRSLYVGDLGIGVAHTEHRGVSHVGAVFPKLERLALRGSRIRLGALALKELRELRIFSSGLETETLNQIATATLPQLGSLELWFGGPPTRDAWPDRTQVVFESKSFPLLDDLAISDPERNALPATIAVLAESSMAARLRTLRFVDGGVERAGRTLLAHAHRFPRLERVIAPPLGFSPETERALADRFTPSPKTRAPDRRAGSGNGE